MTTRAVMTMTGRMDDERRRPLWCSLVDRAVQLAAASAAEPVDIEAVLDSCGIFKWSPFRTRAIAYAKQKIARNEAAK
jgi:hypothetical protein